MPRAGRSEPLRTCVGCRGATSKRDLVRLVRDPGGGVLVDPTGKAPGRGAYLHPDRACAEAATKRGAVARALRTSLGPAEAGNLRAQIEALAAQRARAGGSTTSIEE
jgi:uncharacterized protein